MSTNLRAKVRLQRDVKSAAEATLRFMAAQRGGGGGWPATSNTLNPWLRRRSNSA
jgi:hypothetical protein